MVESNRSGKMSRRALLGVAVAASLAGCTPVATPSPTRSSTPTPTPKPTPTPSAISLAAPFGALEKEFDARLGVWALNTGSLLSTEYRSDERFAFCSTHKIFSAGAVLDKYTIDELETVVQYTHSDLIANSPISEPNVATGMTLRALCDAAVRYSDNTAANLLFRDLGGPDALETFMRNMGDQVSDMSRIEAALSSAIPGDIRDTSTPRAWGADLQKIILGDVLPPEKHAILTDWMVRNTTGAGLIRATVPEGWNVGDKTGSGHYGARNDIAVLWPPKEKPLVLAIMTSRPGAADPYDDDLIARAADAVIKALA
ncbi:class A beta-lactamase [Glaciihabitans sp. UYNi722]|uniref:class A beta-lactamase n=1 Tax=Glaciihabitans sp. UYNi722 TaxID=3156344 RepID=UPI003392F03D